MHCSAGFLHIGEQNGHCPRDASYPIDRAYCRSDYGGLEDRIDNWPEPVKSNELWPVLRTRAVRMTCADSF